MRLWLSGPRIGWFRGREDLRHRMPSWRHYEFQEALKAYAAKHGQPITNAQAAHDIDKAVAMGELDADGPVLHVKGTREEIIEAVMQAGEKFGMPVDRAEAERLDGQGHPAPLPLADRHHGCNTTGGPSSGTSSLGHRRPFRPALPW